MKGGPAIAHPVSEPRLQNQVQRLGQDLLTQILATDDVLDVGKNEVSSPVAGHAIILADGVLQDIADYRGALRNWFEAVKTGGHLVLIVPHAFLAERQMALPVRDRPTHRRLYTPASLTAEIEEALVPNSYRVRLLYDDDRDYDYVRDKSAAPIGNSRVVMAIEKIGSPSWSLDMPGTAGPPAGPDYAFAPPRTRIERATSRQLQRILILKLDHLGDFVMGIAALERARALFGDAHLTLVVGSWNLDLAKSLNIADEVLCFDAFPRNSAEEVPDVEGKRAQFAAMMTERYDLAIDLRTDTDTRTLLKQVRAGLKSGIGRKTDFPFLDFPLAIEVDRVDRESAREYRIDHQAFTYQHVVRQPGYHAAFPGGDSEAGHALVWGPYWRLRAGHYLFEPFLEVKSAEEGLLMLDIAVSVDRVIRTFVTGGDKVRLEFDVERDDSPFEFRIWAVEDTPSLPFDFYGGKLIRQGAPGLLHQSDYLELLLDLLTRRLGRTGLLTELA